MDLSIESESDIVPADSQSTIGNGPSTSDLLASGEGASRSSNMSITNYVVQSRPGGLASREGARPTFGPSTFGLSIHPTSGLLASRKGARPNSV